jgi:hypothetical protein
LVEINDEGVDDDQLRDSGQVPVAAEAARHKKRLRRVLLDWK